MDFRRRHQARDVEVDLTPLIDIIFILLIFFLVTASFDQSSEQSVEVELPEGSAAGEVNVDEELTIFIEEDGEVSLLIGDNALATDVAAGELTGRLSALNEELGARPVFIRGDENVRYGEVVRVLDACRDAGFRKVFNVVRGTP